MSEVSFEFEPKVRTRARLNAEVKATPRTYPARVARQVALAHALERRVRGGEFADYAAMARALGHTRARVSQLMDLLLIAPDIQEEVLFLEVAFGQPQPFTERELRDALSSLDWQSQRSAWVELRPKSKTVNRLKSGQSKTRR